MVAEACEQKHGLYSERSLLTQLRCGFQWEAVTRLIICCSCTVVLRTTTSVCVIVCDNVSQQMGGGQNSLPDEEVLMGGVGINIV